ncbi:unnamed protein product [Schistosoma mattheei]|uniref:Uncharacterized protein n=1 Tax=Schistosoma mattheei TaxID=31246 RepID=A0AA85B3A6_9TREM|nr:unnamed protein product [Schistosoma mattheei]
MEKVPDGRESGRFELISTVLRSRCYRPFRPTYLIQFVKLLILPSPSSGVSLILHSSIFEVDVNPLKN